MRSDPLVRWLELRMRWNSRLVNAFAVLSRTDVVLASICVRHCPFEECECRDGPGPSPALVERQAGGLAIAICSCWHALPQLPRVAEWIEVGQETALPGQAPLRRQGFPGDGYAIGVARGGCLQESWTS